MLRIDDVITDRDVWLIKTTFLAYKLTDGAVERAIFRNIPALISIRFVTFCIDLRYQ